jgi:polysaccharide pyruvyl transferase WcaK-like protein
MAVWEKEKKASANEKYDLAKGMYAAALSEITRATTLISIGGDNFCYNNWHRLLVFQEKAKKIGAKSILWGCSIEPNRVNTEMTDCLNTYDKIITRESETYNSLVRNGINTELLLYPDIAFALEPKPLEFQFQGKFVGINLSPLILKYENARGIIRKNVSRLIDYLFEKTEYKVLLIPHVINPVDNDYAVLEEIYLEFCEKCKGRIFLAGNKLCAAEYKYLISKCEFVFCSRTHASIAAYSTNVPCVVIGYSVKARGIAKDLGMENFLISGADIDKENVLLEKYVREC